MDRESHAGWQQATTFGVGACLVLALYIYYRRATSWRVVPAGVPWFFDDASTKETPAPWSAQVGAHLSDFSKGISFVRTGYEKFSKRGKPFLSPSFVTWQAEVVLPPSQVRWLIEQPDTVLSIDRCLIKDLEFLYTTPTAWSFNRPFHVEAINKLRLEPLIPDMAEEVQASIDREWGLDTEEWKEVNIETTMRSVLVQITARIFVGLPLCRDKDYIAAAYNFMANLGPRAIFISLTPELLRPLAGWYFARDLKRCNAECAASTVPLVKREMGEQPHRPSDQKSMPLPKTLLEQMARLAVRSKDAKDGDPFSVSSRLLALNFVAVHTSNAALVNGLVDILSPPAGPEVYLQLRAEAEEVADACQGKWTKSAVLQLEKIDSALRESLRISTFKARGLERIVVAAKGVTLPDGTYLPRNTKVGVPVLPMHRDGELYPDADRYDALRFCGTQKVDEDAKDGTQRSASPALPSGHVELINTSETFLAFGHGKHACPGRFMAAYELKLILAYIAANYDIQPFDKRAENAEFSDFSVGSFHNLQTLHPLLDPSTELLPASDSQRDPQRRNEPFSLTPNGRASKMATLVTDRRTSVQDGPFQEELDTPTGQQRPDSPKRKSSEATVPDHDSGRKKRRKVNHACVYCRRSHMTCDLERPCARCVKRDIGHLCHDEPRDPPKRSKSEVGVAEIAPAPEEGRQDSGVNGIGNGNGNGTGNGQGHGALQYAAQSNGDMSGLSEMDDPPPPAQPQQMAQRPPISPTQLQRQQAAISTASTNNMPAPNYDWNNSGVQNQFQDMHHLHPNYLFNTSEVTDEYNLLNDFLSSSLLDDGALYNADDALFNDPLLATSSMNALATPTFNPPLQANQRQPQHHHQQAPPTLQPPSQNAKAGEEISRPSSAFPGSDQARDKFYLTAADPAGLSSAGDRLHKLLKAKYDAGMLKPFNYVKGYAKLQSYMSRHLHSSSQRRILEQLGRFRPKFREAMQSLTDMQLVLVEMWFERSLMEYDRVFASMAIPACCWRRTGEIFRGNREMAELIGVPMERLRDGRLAIHEIIAEESLVSYWEKFGAIAFDQSQKAILTSCSLQSPGPEPGGGGGGGGGEGKGAAAAGGGASTAAGVDGENATAAAAAAAEKKKKEERVRCCFSFTIRRDNHNM
ncbi:hypothetical protein LTR36_005559 [Oleoguttula mirabilis]|uniref:Zn(2)-C6 fungal-type domain-containing protein n=1 Tax=Oleoguttula mirabilis TaxID=1507867 RepID=A0AAV9JE01_9PEZI|nr:hypothetical protein LTR36_005559 [Oleoguttula mirabilis]